MKSKPVVMEHFSTIHTSFIVDFTFTNNLTILMGDSGTGKTATTSFIISQENGKLIVIDNADILLDDDSRKYISLDDKNQYLIIGRNPKNFFATKENLFELVSTKIGEQTKFTIQNYL